MLAATLWSGALGAADLLAELEGWYAVPPQTCLHIVRLSATQATVHLFGIWHNRSSCDVLGTATLENGELRLAQGPYLDAIGVEKGQGARIRVSAGALVFDLLRKGADPFCGPEATLRGSTFKRSARRDKPGMECAP